jgi:hypothetical protein
VKSSVRWLVLVGSVIVIVVLFVLLRPGSSGDGGSPTPSTLTPTVSPSASETSSPSPEPEPQPVIDVTFRDGKVRGPTEFTVSQGERVQIVVHADVTDEVHLHSYDLHADVAPGEPARIEFVADVAGVFECELEDASTLLFQLEISP